MLNKYKEDKELLNSGILKQWIEEKIDIQVWDIIINEYDHPNDIDELDIRVLGDVKFQHLIEISNLLLTKEIYLGTDADYKLCIFVENWDFAKLKEYKIKKDLQRK